MNTRIGKEAYKLRSVNRIDIDALSCAESLSVWPDAGCQAVMPATLSSLCSESWQASVKWSCFSDWDPFLLFVLFSPVTTFRYSTGSKIGDPLFGNMWSVAKLKKS